MAQKAQPAGTCKKIVEVRYDCDEDALLYRVQQTGAACHTGEYSCFYRSLGEPAPPGIGEMMGTLERVIETRLKDLPEGSYVAKLHDRGLGYVSQKVVEEAGESIVAALEHKPAELIGEAADLLFHLTVLLARERCEFARRGRKAFGAASGKAVVWRGWVVSALTTSTKKSCLVVQSEQVFRRKTHG